MLEFFGEGCGEPPFVHKKGVPRSISPMNITVAGARRILVKREAFDKLVAEALDQLPEEFREKLENVEVIVEDFADPETLRSLGVRSKWELLGLYVGVPLTHRSFFSFNTLPERIYLYYHPILREAGRPQSLVETIRDVVIHEVGHHFGFDDDELEEMSRRNE